jgi:hypothetical protein
MAGGRRKARHEGVRQAPGVAISQKLPQGTTRPIAINLDPVDRIIHLSRRLAEAAER